MIRHIVFERKGNILFAFLRAGGIAGLLLYFWPILRMICGRGRPADEFAAIDSSALIQIVYLALIVSSNLFWLLKHTSIFYAFVLRRPIIWMGLYVLVCLMSAFWSSIPQLTLYRAIEMTAAMILIVRIATRFGTNSVALAQWIVIWAMVTGVMFSLPYHFPLKLSLDGWHGYAVYVIGPVFFLTLSMRRQQRWIFWVFLAAVVISTATKAYLGIMLGALAYAIVTGNRKAKVLCLSAICVLVLFILSADRNTFIAVLFPTKGEAEVLQGTGRIGVWTALIEVGEQSPYIGHGFAVGESLASNVLGTNTTTAHNAFLAAWVNTGVLGVLFVALLLVDSIACILKLRGHPLASSLIGCAMVGLVFAMFDNGIGSRVMGTWLSQVFIVALVVVSSRERAE